MQKVHLAVGKLLCVGYGLGEDQRFRVQKTVTHAVVLPRCASEMPWPQSSGSSKAEPYSARSVWVSGLDASARTRLASEVAGRGLMGP